MVYTVYVEKIKEFANEAIGLKNDLVELLQIKGLEDLRILNRYDVENIDEELFEYSIKTVFSEPQVDVASRELPKENATVFAVEFLPGQFDQRANSAAECIQLISKKERPLVKTMKVYMLYGELSENDIKGIKNYVINPVEAREASLEKLDTLKVNYEIPTTVMTLDNFNKLNKEELTEFIKEYGLAMDIDELVFLY